MTTSGSLVPITDMEEFMRQRPFMPYIPLIMTDMSTGKSVPNTEQIEQYVQGQFEEYKQKMREEYESE